MANKSQLDVLIGIYREAQARLAEIVTGNYGAGTRTYYNSVLKQLERLMKQLEAETRQYISTEIPKQYKKALDDTYAYFKRNNLQMKRPDMFSHIHSDAVSELANEMRYHINQGISIAGRRVMRYLDTAKDNALRQAGLRSTALKVAAGQTVADMQKDLMQRLANDGFLTVQYGTGKRAYQVGLDSYAAMVARSTTREAGNLAREKQLTENGYDLMMMTEHYPTCEACAVLQGRVYSISGRDKRFPPLSRAFPSGYRNVHPNCRHVMTYWIEEMQSPEEIRAALARSNAPFTDNRSDEEIALYSKQQADSRRMRADRSQFERYRQRLGEDAPKSFHTFRRIKNADGQKWKEMQSLYRSKFPKNVDNSGESGIIEETSKKSITKITDKVIDNVPNVKISGYTDEQCSIIQQQHKELLRYSRDNNESKEVAFVFDSKLNNRKEFKGSDDKLDFGSTLYGKELFVMHNHPRNSSYSLNDIIFFWNNDNIKTFTIMKNNGGIEYITKGNDYDFKKFKLEYDRLYKKIVINDNDVEKDKLVRTLLNKTRSGVIWSDRK
mgnify:FL=1